MQYRIKPGIKEELKQKGIKFNKLAEVVGINRCYMSEIMNARRKTISKTLAFCICKSISPTLEIPDLFNVYDE